MENKPGNAPKGRRPLDIIYPVALVLLAGFAIFMTFKNQELEKEKVTILEDCANTEQEKALVVDQLTDLQEEFGTLQTDNEALQAEIDSQRVHIAELLKEAEKHKDDAYIIYKLKKEAATLREIMKGYLHTIDSLNTLNITLREEKSQVERALSSEKQRTSNLESEKESLAEKVKIGSKLEAMEMVSIAQRVKSNGVHRPTTKAIKAEKIKTCLSLSRNEVLEPGKKIVYLRIQTPDGKILSLGEDEKNLFDYEGVRGLYSVKKVVDYQNQELPLCMYWEVKSALPAGEYEVAAYVDEMLIGTTKFSLK
ncbi:MAG: hypothetical protein ACFB10_11045 [Salibacteraceae bacterium]